MVEERNAAHDTHLLRRALLVRSPPQRHYSGVLKFDEPEIRAKIWPEGPLSFLVLLFFLFFLNEQQHTVASSTHTFF